MNTPNDVLGSVLKEMITGEIEELAARPENLGLKTLEPELYPFMSRRELRMSILLGTHTKTQPMAFNDSIIFTSVFDSENCKIILRDGIYSFDIKDKTSSGIALEFEGTWLINSHHGKANLGPGTISMYVKERSEEDKSPWPRLDKLQNFHIRLNRASEEDYLHGEIIINPAKWSKFTESLSLINEKSWTIQFNHVFACSPGFEHDIPNGVDFPCIGPVYSVGGSDFLVQSGKIRPPEDIAFDHILMIKKPEFVSHELIEYVMQTNNVEEVEANKRIMTLPSDNYAAISHHASTLDMAIGFKLLKSLGLDPKIQAQS